MQALASLYSASCMLSCFLSCLYLRFRQQLERGQYVRSLWFRDILKLWPVWILPALIGIALYLQVHLEGRYLPSFLLVLAAVPLARLFLLRVRMRGRSTRFRSMTLVASRWPAAWQLLWSVNRPADHSPTARHHVRYSDSAAMGSLRVFLQQHGLATRRCGRCDRRTHRRTAPGPTSIGLRIVALS